MTDLSNLNVLSALLNMFSGDEAICFLLLSVIVLGAGFRSSIRSIARCLMVLLLMPLLILTTLLNYRLRLAGKDILSWDYLKYLCGEEDGDKSLLRINQKKEKAKSDVIAHTRSF